MESNVNNAAHIVPIHETHYKKTRLKEAEKGNRVVKTAPSAAQ